MSHRPEARLSPAARATADAAIDFVDRGWSVIPVEPRGKRPLIPWLELQTRLPRPDEIVDWFVRYPAANVAIVTGILSGLVIVDVDPEHGGEESLAVLTREHGPLPPTPTVQTGGGGHHLYFAHPGGAVPNRVGLRHGVDVRADGGCVVAPPSTHPSGRRYRWQPGQSPADLTPAPLPHWLRVLVAPGTGRPGHPLAHWRQLVKAVIAEGERNNTIASLAGHLLWHGVDSEVALDLLLAWNRVHCAPPLSDAEVAGVVHSIATLHARDREGE